MSTESQDVWNETVAITRPIREQILRYLYQQGRTSAAEIRDELYLRRTAADRNFRSLIDRNLLEKTVERTTVRYELTERGTRFVADEVLGGT